MSKPLPEPRYSVIIPTANHPDLLKRCLKHLADAKPLKDEWEILVIDNSDASYRTANRMTTESNDDLRIIYHEMPPLGLMAARHKGAELGSGNVLCFIDDDSFVDSTWPQGIEEAYHDQKIVLATGPIRGEFEASPPSWVESLWDNNQYGRACAYLSLLDFGEEYKEIDPLFVWGCNYSIRRETFYQARGSHPDYLPAKWWAYQGDGECGLSNKVKALGHSAHYSPKCSIKHLVPASRMAFEYLGTRAYFVGLHSSFTDIRRKHGLGAFEGVPSPEKRSLISKIASRLKRYGGDIWQIVTRSQHMKTVIQLRTYLKKRFKEGYNAHQHEVIMRPQLLGYVLRKDYLGDNGVIPEDTPLSRQADIHNSASFHRPAHNYRR